MENENNEEITKEQIIDITNDGDESKKSDFKNTTSRLEEEMDSVKAVQLETIIQNEGELDVEKVEENVQIGEYDPDKEEFYGMDSIQTALHNEQKEFNKLKMHSSINKAVYENQINDVRTILQNSLDKFEVAMRMSLDKMLPLHQALLNSNSQIVKLLMESGADSSIEFQRTPVCHLALAPTLFEGSCSKAIECFEELFANSGSEVKVNEVDRLGRSLFHIMALNDIQVLSNKLFDLGLDINIKDINGDTAVHTAIRYQRINILQIFLHEMGIKILELTDSEEDNLIHYSLKKRSWKCLTIIIKHCGLETLETNNHNGNTLEEIAKKMNILSEFENLLEQLEDNMDNIEKMDYSRIERRRGEIIIITHESCEKHVPLSTFYNTRMEQKSLIPENSERINVLTGDSPKGILECKEFKSQGIWLENPPPATIFDILRVHNYNYIQKIKNKCDLIPDYDTLAKFDADTYINKESFSVAKKASGTVIAAVDKVMEGIDSKIAFCCIRPPGHHIGPFGNVPPEEFQNEGSSTGFCILNNIGIGAAYAKYTYRDRIHKIALVDFDIHHGNGTEAIIRNLNPAEEFVPIQGPFCAGYVTTWNYKPWLDEDDPQNVLFISIHGYEPFTNFYPFSGSAKKNSKEEDSEYPGGILNIPIKNGTTSGEWRDKCRKEMFPRLLEFDPDLIFVSSGFDGHESDVVNMGFGCLTEYDFFWITEKLISIANTCSSGRLISVLEGGYNTKGGIVSPFAQSVWHHLSAFLHNNQGEYVEEEEPEKLDELMLGRKRQIRLAQDKIERRKRIKYSQDEVGDGSNDSSIEEGINDDYEIFKNQLFSNEIGDDQDELGEQVQKEVEEGSKINYFEHVTHSSQMGVSVRSLQGGEAEEMKQVDNDDDRIFEDVINVPHSFLFDEEQHPSDKSEK